MENKETKITNWEDEYTAERPVGDSKFFSDQVTEGQLSFKATIKFLSTGEKVTNKFEKECIRFQIESGAKKLTWDVGTNQWELLKSIAHNKPLIGKTAELERVGSTQKDTKRTIKF
jgi:hypothetical protein